MPVIFPNYQGSQVTDIWLELAENAFRVTAVTGQSAALVTTITLAQSLRAYC